MANEFRIKNGFISEGSSIITGSLDISAGITGSLSGSISGDINLPGLATGSVLFTSGLTGAITGSSNLFWDNTNERLGIGTISPSQKLTVEGNIELGTGGYVYGDTTNPALYLNNSAGSFLQYTTSNRVGIGSGVITFTTSGAERARIVSTGNILIGTTTDAGYKLAVAGDTIVSGASKLYLRDSLTYIWESSGLTLDSGHSTRPIKALIAGVEKFRVNTDGNVGIGTTTPEYKLDVNGTTRVQGLTVTGSIMQNASTASFGGIVNVGTVTTASSQLNVSNGSLTVGAGYGYAALYGSASDGIFQVRDAGTGFLGSAYSTQLVLRPAGNVASYNSNYWAYLEQSAGGFLVTSGRYQPLYLRAGTGGSANDMYFQSSTNNVMMIKGSTSNVMIGTTTDSGYKLNVNGTGNYEGNLRLGVGFQLIFNNNNVGLYRDSNTLRLGGYGGVEILSSATNISAQTIRMKIFDTGNVGINTTTDVGYKLNVSGSGNFTDGLTVTGSVTATSFTGSLEGTASYATTALSASYAPASPITIGSTSLSSGTVGRVLFEGTGNVIQESGNLFWDDTNGRLGLGTSSPDVKLHIFDSFRIGRTGYTSAQSGFAISKGHNTTISQTGGDYIDISSALYVRNNGNIGINTTTDAGYKLDVNGTARVSGLVTLNNNILLNAASSTNSIVHNSTYSSSTFSVLEQLNGSNIGGFIINTGTGESRFGSFRVGGGYYTTFYVNNAELIRLSTSNNVLINTTTDAGYKLDVNGTTRSQGNLTVGAASSGTRYDMNFNVSFPGTGTRGGIVWSSGASILNRRKYSGGNDNTLSFLVSNSTVELLTIQEYNGTVNTNNVGINNTNPNVSAILDVASTTKGFLPPRTNLTSNISAPAQGLITYLTGSSNEGLYYYNSGSAIGWHKVLTNSGSQDINGSLTATSFTGSLLGTASYATTAGSTAAVAGTTNYVAKFSSGTTIGDSQVYDNGTNVGIGTTSPSTKLHTSFSDNAFAVNTTIENTNTGSNAVAAISFKNASQNAFNIFQVNSSGDASLYNTATSGKINFWTNTTQRMTITSDGNVGIGTSSPASKLHAVNDNFCFLTAEASGFGKMNIGSSGGIGVIYTTDSNPIIIDPAAHFAINTNSTERLRVADTTGYVGIGTSSPASTLDVVGDIGLSNDLYDQGGNLLYWSPTSNALYAGGYDAKNNISSYLDQGSTSISNYASISGNWADVVYYNGQVLSRVTTGAAITAGQLCYLRTDGTWYPANASGANTSTSLLGIALDDDGTGGNNISVLLDGIVNTAYHTQNGTATPGLPLYIESSNTGSAGDVTQTAPSSTGEVVRLIGHNIVNSGGNGVIIRFQPDNTWIEL